MLISTPAAGLCENQLQFLSSLIKVIQGHKIQKMIRIW